MKTIPLVIALLAVFMASTEQSSAAVLNPPTPNSPGDASSPGPFITSSIFTWSSVAGATGYGLYIRDLTTNTPVFSSNGSVSSIPAYNLPAGYLAPGHSFRWAVTTVNADGESVSSSYRYFQTGLPNLVPYQPANWSDKIVVNNLNTSLFGSQTDAASLSTTDAVYVYIAGANRGSADVLDTNYADIYLDGVYTQVRLSLPPANLTNYWLVQFSPGPLGAGTHSIRIVNDPTGLVTESNESDNEYTKTFTVNSSGTEPLISGISPNPVLGSNSQQTITINGARFVNKPTLTVSWTNQPDYIVPDDQVTYVSATQLQMAITTELDIDDWTVAVINPDGQSSGRFGFQVVAAPEITVQQPLNTNIADGGSKSFGSVPAGGNSSLTFYIKNTGVAALTGLTITKNGTDAAMFTVTASPTAPVAPGGSTTFTVRFAPVSSGPKSAAIHIASNVPGSSNPFDIALTGAGTTPAGIYLSGPASVTTKSQTPFLVMLPSGGGSPVDVTSASAVGFAATPGAGISIAGNYLLVSADATAQTIYLQARYSNGAGGTTSVPVAVSVQRAFSATASAASAHQNGTNYTITLTGSATCGTVPYIYRWDTNGDGVYGDVTGSSVSYTKSSQGGTLPVKLEVTDSANVKVYAHSQVVIDKPPVVLQARRVKPLGDVSSGTQVYDHDGHLFQFDTARMDKGLIVVTHGLYATGLDSWVRDMTQRLNSRLGVDAPNIIAFDWSVDNDPGGKVSPMKLGILEAIDRASSVINLAGAAKKGLRFFVAKAFEEAAGALLPSSSDIAETLDLSVDSIYIRAIAQAHGQMLAAWLREQAKAGLINPDKPIHLIGHSAGGVLMGECALWLKQHPLLNGKVLVVDRVTMLDTPFPVRSHIAGLTQGLYPTAVERVISSYFGSLELPSTMIVPSSSLFRNKWLGSFLPRLGFGETGHGLAHVWYRRTIQPGSETNGSDLDGYGTDGFSYSPFQGGYMAPRPMISGSLAPMRMAANFSDGEQPPPTSFMTGFTTFGNVSSSGSNYTLTEQQGDAGIYQNITIPAGAQALRLNFQFTAAGDGDFISVRFADLPDLYLGMDTAISRDGFTTVDVPLEAIDGLTGDLVISLVSRGTDNAVAEVADIDFVISDDPDGDGLTTAQETSLGTNPLAFDSDSDGLDDLTEVNTTLTNPLMADSDGDGMSDSQEIIAGTNGMNANSVFRADGTTVAANGAVTVAWAAKAGKTYRVQRSDSPAFSNYTMVGDSIPGMEPTTNFTDSTVPGGTARMFYRVEVVVP